MYTISVLPVRARRLNPMARDRPRASSSQEVRRRANDRSADATTTAALPFAVKTSPLRLIHGRFLRCPAPNIDRAYLFGSLIATTHLSSKPGIGRRTTDFPLWLPLPQVESRPRRAS